jgi:hypothetical protein
MATNGPQPRGVLLVGSVPLHNAEEVFRLAGAILGDRLRRIPDGETGERLGYVLWQYPVLANHPLLEAVAPDPFMRPSLPRVRLQPGAAGDLLTFDRLGYADVAKASFADFWRLKQEGLIPGHCRFQVSLPGPYMPITTFVVQEEQAVVEPPYEARLLAEVDEIAAAIPRDQLAIQWDFGMSRWGAAPWFDPARADEIHGGIIERLIRYGNRVPADVELGYHLCFGDYGGEHNWEPDSLASPIEVANAVSQALSRPVNWVHMPVPRRRTDDAYFAPLRDLRLQPLTELYLGLVHLADGVAGTQQRIATALRVVPRFGVGTECGLGRRAPETVPDILRLLTQVTAPVV